jgi:acetyl esterase/lipase
MGDSGGGGLAAAAALMARARGGPAIARQILIFPMLDDRNTVLDPELAPFALWTYDDNATGWGALLGDATGGPDVAPYAAPARVVDPAGLPAAYIEVGQLDIFRDEDIAYAQRLSSAGVDVEFHLHPGVPHEFETLAPDSGVARRAIADRIRVLASL